MRIIVLRERFDHMSPFSGYDLLFRFLNIKTESIICKFKTQYPRGIGRILLISSRIFKLNSFYNAQSFTAEFKLILKSIFKKYDIIHYSYGEPYFGIGSRFRFIFRAKIVLTIHQPITWWEKNLTKIKNYNAAQCLIVLSENDKAFFDEKLTIPVAFIPHGVDTEFYKPSSEGKHYSHTFNVLFSGRYLRDMHTLAEVIEKACILNKNICFQIIYLPLDKIENQKIIKLIQEKKIELYFDLEPQEYLNIFQNADCFLLPLLDCTANNAILEAMACGLPIITSNLPAIKSYLNESYSFLISDKCIDSYIKALLILNDNNILCQDMGISARERAVQDFDWNIIAKKTLELYSKLLRN